MGVKIPAAFEDATGTITRLTGEIELELPATPGQVLTANNPATSASFQAGGGGGAAVQAVYLGNAVSIADGATIPLTFDQLDSGVELLDRTDPADPLFLTDGTYALTVGMLGDALTAPGFAVGRIDAPGYTNAAAAFTIAPSYVWGVTAVFVAAAGDDLLVRVSNHDGVSARNFQILNAILVKL